MRREYCAALAVVAAILSSCVSNPSPAPPSPVPTRIIVPADTTTPIPPTPSPLTGCATTDSLRIRRQPNTHSEILGALQANACVKVFATNAERTWVSIGTDAPSGWVSLQYLSLQGDVAQLPIGGDELSRLDAVVLPTATNPLPPTAKPLPVYPTNTPRPAVSSLLSCAATGSHVGEFVSCRMQRAYCSYRPSVGGSPTFCNDAPYPGHSFTLVAWGADWSDYDGKCLIVTGLVTFYSGKPQIEGSNRSQVSYCP